MIAHVREEPQSLNPLARALRGCDGQIARQSAWLEAPSSRARPQRKREAPLPGPAHDLDRAVHGDDGRADAARAGLLAWPIRQVSAVAFYKPTATRTDTCTCTVSVW